jgi:hypothetical protein
MLYRDCPNRANRGYKPSNMKTKKFQVTFSFRHILKIRVVYFAPLQNSLRVRGCIQKFPD